MAGGEGDCSACEEWVSSTLARESGKGVSGRRADTWAEGMRIQEKHGNTPADMLVVATERRVFLYVLLIIQK